jgi:hypothetical protein
MGMKNLEISKYWLAKRGENPRGAKPSWFGIVWNFGLSDVLSLGDFWDIMGTHGWSRIYVIRIGKCCVKSINYYYDLGIIIHRLK